MPVRGPALHGNLDHCDLRLGRKALANGEKSRPYYLGTLIEFQGQDQVSKTADDSSSERPS
jgi:hypothetical protein